MLRHMAANEVCMGVEAETHSTMIMEWKPE